jgi:hypothetical protein
MEIPDRRLQAEMEASAWPNSSCGLYWHLAVSVSSFVCPSSKVEIAVPDFEHLNFADAYCLAMDVREWFVENPDDGELDDHDIINVNDHDVVCRLAEPHRWSLLHHFILEFFPSHYIVDFEYARKDMLDTVVMEYSTILKLHGLQTPRRLRWTFRSTGYVGFSCTGV